MAKVNSASSDIIKSLATTAAKCQAQTSKTIRAEFRKKRSLINRCKDISSLIPFLADENDDVRCEALEAIGELDSPEVYEILAKALEDPLETFRQQAIEIAADKKLVDVLVKALHDASAEVRESAIWNLTSFYQEPAIVDPLINILRSPDEPSGCRGAAVSVLKNVDDERIIDLFLEQLEDESVDYLAAEALAKYHDPRGFDSLLRVTESGSKPARIAAARGVTKRPDERALAPLLKMLAESDQEYKAAAAWSLGLLGRRLPEVCPHQWQAAVSTAEPLLCEAYGSDDEKLREGVLFALGEIRSLRAVDLTRTALADSSSGVRFQAFYNLEKLQDRSFVGPLIKLLDDDELLPDVLGALGVLGEKAAIEHIVPFLERDEFEVQVKAAKALLQLGDRRGWPILVSALADEDWDWSTFDRAVVADVMMAFDKIAAKEVFLELLQSFDLDHPSDYQLFVSMVRGIGESGDQGAIGPLSLFLDHQYDTSVQAIVADSLLNLGDPRGWDILAAALGEDCWFGPQSVIREDFLASMNNYDRAATVDAVLNALPSCKPTRDLDRYLMEKMIDILVDAQDSRAVEHLQSLQSCKFMGRKASEALKLLGCRKSTLENKTGQKAKSCEAN